MPQSEHCVALPAIESHACSPAPITADSQAAAMYSLITAAKLNDIDPQAWLTDVWSELRDIRAIISIGCCRGTGCASLPSPWYDNNIAEAGRMRREQK